MNPKTFDEMYVTELAEFRSVEEQMAENLDVFADQATDAALVELIRSHRAMTAKHRDRLSEMLEAHGERPDAHSDGSMSALVSEAEKWAGMVDDPALRDAGLIASLQRMEHYEIAVAGTLARWAESLGHQSDARALASILEDDKATDARFSEIAEHAVNPVSA
jgi:ferritin-like metal-binding protein YciE